MPGNGADRLVVRVALRYAGNGVSPLVMFPVLAAMHVRLARREERALSEQFGEAYQQYAARTPAFIPNLASLARARGLQGQQGS